VKAKIPAVSEKNPRFYINPEKGKKISSRWSAAKE
jgi:hypothetical protein